MAVHLYPPPQAAACHRSALLFADVTLPEDPDQGFFLAEDPDRGLVCPDSAGGGKNPYEVTSSAADVRILPGQVHSRTASRRLTTVGSRRTTPVRVLLPALLPCKTMYRSNGGMSPSPRGR